jgi:hypothetical protein
MGNVLVESISPAGPVYPAKAVDMTSISEPQTVAVVNMPGKKLQSTPKRCQLPGKKTDILFGALRFESF